MSSNKSVKERLIKLYGNKCFIERLKLRDTTGLKYTGCGQYKRMKQLTYHHILEKSKGGKATVENGALLSAENHEWFHKQSKPDQKIMNNMFQELKRSIDYQECSVELVDEVKCPFEANYIEMCIDEKGQPEFKKLEYEQERLDIKKIRDKQRRKEKRELQRIKKEVEDR